MKLKLYFNTQGQYSLLSATSSSEMKGKKLPYHYRSRSSTVKAISDFLVTIYKFYPRHTVPTDQRLNTDFNNSRIEPGKKSHLQVACSLSRNERENNSENASEFSCSHFTVIVLKRRETTVRDIHRQPRGLRMWS